MSTQWHVLRLEHARAHLAAEHLRRNQIEYFQPMCRISRRKVAPLFVGYAFAHVDPLAGMLVFLRQLPGIWGYLRDGSGRPATLTEAAITSIRDLEADLAEATRRPEFRRGDKVRIGDDAGAWAGFLGIVAKLHGRDRVTIRLLLGPAITLPATWVELQNVSMAPANGAWRGSARRSA